MILPFSKVTFSRPRQTSFDHAVPSRYVFRVPKGLILNRSHQNPHKYILILCRFFTFDGQDHPDGCPAFLRTKLKKGPWNMVHSPFFAISFWRNSDRTGRLRSIVFSSPLLAQTCPALSGFELLLLFLGVA